MSSPVARNANARAGAAAWRRALPTLAALIVIVLCVTAGNWQRTRMQQKERDGEMLRQAEISAPVRLPEGVTDWASWRFRRVGIEGRYDEIRQILIDNKVHAGRVGYHVVTPLEMADGRVILVNRGFVAGGPTRAELPAVPPPSGNVYVQGRLNLPSTDYVELRGTAPQGPVWQNLDPARYAAASGLNVLPVVIYEIGGPDDGLVRDWPRPDTGSDKHRIYMMQWYMFAALAFVIWAWFTFRRRPR